MDLTAHLLRAAQVPMATKPRQTKTRSGKEARVEDQATAGILTEAPAEEEEAQALTDLDRPVSHHAVRDRSQ